MRSYYAIIVEDEKNVREALLELLTQNCPQIKVCGMAGSAVEARILLKKNQVDFIFLVIAMPNEDGFVFLNSIPTEKYGVIFTTAYHEFVLRALRANAVDYLLKPIDSGELREAVSKAIHYHRLRDNDFEVLNVYRNSLDGVEDHYITYGKNISRITVSEQFGYKIINLYELMYLEADSNYTTLHLANGKRIIATRNLGEFEKIIENPMFFRIHKTFLVNVKYISGYTTVEGSFAELHNGMKLAISRRKIIEFRMWLKKYSASID
ncbi:MAG: response regulator transcription factor [Bacteroidales bacterium]|nr:response regulator transcription factor [Bacteroidales bacterium]